VFDKNGGHGESFFTWVIRTIVAAVITIIVTAGAICLGIPVDVVGGNNTVQPVTPTSLVDTFPSTLVPTLELPVFPGEGVVIEESYDPVGWNQGAFEFGCPYDPDGWELPVPNTWYVISFDSYQVMHDLFGDLWVFNPYDGYSYPLGAEQVMRDVWLNVSGTPVDICVDSYGYVFARRS
jgi:hypothetical protein